MAKEPIKKQAYDLLYRKIMTCDYMPGLFLTEKDMAEETGLGRTPLREAVIRLQKDGLIQIYPRKGMRITPITEDSIQQHYQVRKLFEPTIITQYCSLYSKRELLRYETRFQQSEQEESLPHFELDAQFHTFLISITQNDILLNMYHSLMLQQVRLAMFAAHQGIRNREGNLEQHEEIIVSLLRENPEAAKDALTYHLNQSMVNSLKCVCQPDA